jgi:hypothetical protein
VAKATNVQPLRTAITPHAQEMRGLFLLSAICEVAETAPHRNLKFNLMVSAAYEPTSAPCPADEAVVPAIRHSQ